MAQECDYCGLPVRRAAADTDAGTAAPVYCCFGCRLAAQITRARGEEGHAAWMLARLGIAVFLSMSVMVFSLYLYGQEVYNPGVERDVPMSRALWGLMRYASLLFATPVFFLLGVPILRNAVEQARRGVWSTDALIVVGVGAAFVHSYAATLRESGHTYFETACMILVLVTLGRWLEASGRLRASEAVRALAALLPDRVTVQREAAVVEVAASALRAGDQVRVLAGERIAVDGVIDEGRASVDEQIVTGESAPQVRETGDAVRGGTLVLDGTLWVRATAVGHDTALSRMVELLEAARRSRGRYQRLADRAASVFLPLTGVVAVGAAVLGYQRGGADEATMTALAVLLIACPCALGIATPMAFWVAMGQAARRGVLVRAGEMLERLAGVGAVCFDKTGTLTTGRPDVTTFVAAGNGAGESAALAWAAALGGQSTHATGRSIATFARERGAGDMELPGARTIPGRGLLATADMGEVRLGSVAMMSEGRLLFDEDLHRARQRIVASGESIACIGWDRSVRAVFGLSEQVREEAPAAIEALLRAGLHVEVLTGDHRRAAEALGRRLGVTVQAELLPEDKVAHLHRLRARVGPVAMVGDGINDAPSLAAADVSLAMGCGADVARESAGVCLLGDDLRMIPWLTGYARKAVAAIRINLFWAFVYNVVGVALAASGRLSPVLAAAAMVLSSALVTGNSLRLARAAGEGPACTS